MPFLPRVAYLLTLLGLPACFASAGELFNGHDLAGWELVATPATEISTVCKILPDGVISVTGQPVGFLATTTSHENYRLHAEWRWSGKPGNGGVPVLNDSFNWIYSGVPIVAISVSWIRAISCLIFSASKDMFGS